MIGLPVLPEAQEQLPRVYLAKGTLSTTAIEGNTLTEKQVLQHMEGRLHLPRAKAYLQRECRQHPVMPITRATRV